MNQLQNVFNYQGNEVRTVIKNENPWFVAADVCRILGIDTSVSVNGQLRNKPDGTIERSGGLDDDEKDTHIVSTLGGHQEVLIVSEPGLYSLVLKSRKPEAKLFKRWITHEVIPSIRKTGSYSAQPKSSAEMFLMVAEQMVANEKRMDSIEEKLTVANHRINSLDTVNIEGDLQQRLNQMIRKYAYANGIQYPQAWKEFRAAYNTAYHTNITSLVENYKEKFKIKGLSVPDYLARTERLEDALRVADKMLNQRELLA